VTTSLEKIFVPLPNSLVRQAGGVIYFVDEKNYQIADVRANLINLNVSYTTNMASEVSFSVSDTGLKMLENNYFSIGRIVAYVTETFGTIEGTRNPDVRERQTQLFEIANVTVSQGPGASPVVEVRCYSRAIQQMKRDRSPGSIKGSGTAFVQQAAKKYGLKFWGENTSKKQQINKASGGNKADSVWDVITNLAGEAKFVVFEVDGYLIFASEKFLLKRWGTHEIPLGNKKTKKKSDKKQNKYIPLIYKPHFQQSSVRPYTYTPTIESSQRNVLQLLSVPNMTISENNPWDGSGNAIIDRFNAVRLRPGMTVKIEGVPTFNGYYLIDSVTFSDLVPDPVNISFKKPEKEEKEIKDLEIGKKGPQVIDVLANTSATQNQVFKQEDIPRFFTPPAGFKIFPLPTPDAPMNYPTPSAGIFETGNINLWDRPIFVVDGEPRTLYSATFTTRTTGVNAGKPYAILIPQIWTITGEPKQVYRSQVLSGFRSSDPEGVTPMPSSTVYENAQYFNYVVSDVSGMLSGDIVSIIPVQFSGLSNSSKNMIANTVFPVTNVNYAENKITVHVKSPKQRKLMDDIQNKIIGGFIESSNPSFRLWESSGLFLAKARGSTLREAIANASNYGKTLSRQQLDVVKKRFPRGDYSNTPGAA
jgi:hypothetical protein